MTATSDSIIGMTATSNTVIRMTRVNNSVITYAYTSALPPWPVLR
jgi:hypothetical protein